MIYVNKVVEKTNQQKTGDITSNCEGLGRWEEKNKYKGKGWKRKNANEQCNRLEIKN